jgi:hypothetical protein
MSSDAIWFNGGGSRGRVDPSTFTRRQLAQMLRGSIWTARSNIPYGPRPNQDSNICAMDFFEVYARADQEQMLADYKRRLYTAAPFGPFAGGDCYHGKYPCETGLPTQQRWDAILDIAQWWWDQGVAPVYFAKPDGWEQDLGQLDALDALHRQPRAQQLLRIVIYPGWEPSGDKYGWKNSVWVDMAQRGARVFPQALLGLHTPSDLDAPIGGDDDPVAHLPDGKSVAWQRILPSLHFWAVQIQGYLATGPAITEPFFTEFKKLWPDYNRRFRPGGAWHFPTAWGGDESLLVGYAEGASYEDFWSDWPESTSQALGDAAIAAGAAFYFDGGTVAIPSMERG